MITAIIAGVAAITTAVVGAVEANEANNTAQNNTNNLIRAQHEAEERAAAERLATARQQSADHLMMAQQQAAMNELSLGLQHDAQLHQSDTSTIAALDELSTALETQVQQAKVSMQQEENRHVETIVAMDLGLNDTQTVQNDEAEDENSQNLRLLTDIDDDGTIELGRDVHA